MIHHEEIDDSLGDNHIEERLVALKKSQARIILLHSNHRAAKKIFVVNFFSESNSFGKMGPSPHDFCVSQLRFFL